MMIKIVAICISIIIGIAVLMAIAEDIHQITKEK